MNKNSYRPDIDGLRAFAVCAVILYHAFPGYCKSGFVGVDVFFVISGFLISSIIFKDLETGNFSFVSFYQRRVRRIFPALICVLLFCIAIGWIVLLPDEYMMLGKHIGAGAAYISNFVLWSEAGYFDAASNTKPLLHLWSLAIEEQFYILWPLLISLTFRYKKNILNVIIAAIIVSALSCFYFMNVKFDSAAGFYAPWNRVWELMSGAALAWLALYYKGVGLSSYMVQLNNTLTKRANRVIGIKTLIVNQVMSLMGLVLLVFSVGDINTTLPFPSFYTLLPLLGTLLLIAAGSEAWINRIIFSNRLVVFIGLISYPLYLWHWPLLSIATIVEGVLPSRSIRVVCVLLSFVMAYLTYAIVEKHLRYGRYGNAKACLLMITVCFIGLFGYFGIFKANGIPDRFYGTKFENLGRVNNLSKADKEIYDKEKQAEILGKNTFPQWINDNICKLEKPLGQNNIALIGDSHATHLYIGLLEKSTSNDGVMVLPASAAAPYLDILTSAKGKEWARKNNDKLIRLAYETILDDERVKVVGLCHYPYASYSDIVDINDKEETDRNKIMRKAMIKTFDLLNKANKRVIVVLDNPNLPQHPKRFIDRPFRLKKGVVGNSYLQKDDKNKEAKKWYNDLVLEISKQYDNITIFDSSKVFEAGDSYIVIKNGKLLYMDYHHLNLDGSRLVAEKLWPIIKINLDR